MNTARLPRVIANFAMTWDGRVSTRNRTPSNFSSPADKRRLFEIRSLGDALLVGRGTVEADTMSMRLRDPTLRAARVARGQPPEPLRAIASARGHLDPAWKVFAPGGAPVVVYTAPSAAKRAAAALSTTPASVIPASDALTILADLRARFGARTVVCEGGPSLLRTLVAAGTLDELYLTVCPLLFGGAKAPTLLGPKGTHLARSLRLHLREVAIRDGECYLHFAKRIPCTRPTTS